MYRELNLKPSKKRVETQFVSFTKSSTAELSSPLESYKINKGKRIFKLLTDDDLYQKFDDFRETNPFSTKPYEVLIKRLESKHYGANKLNKLRFLFNEEENMGRLYVPDVLREDLQDIQSCCRLKNYEPKSHFIYATKNWHFAKNLIIFYPSPPGIPGFWNRSWLLEDGVSLEKASVIPFIVRGHADGYGCLLLIPYFNVGSNNKPLLGSENPLNHVKTFWSRISEYARGKIFIIAHKSGCELALKHANLPLNERIEDLPLIVDGTHISIDRFSAGTLCEADVPKNTLGSIFKYFECVQRSQSLPHRFIIKNKVESQNDSQQIDKDKTYTIEAEKSSLLVDQTEES
ncbi:DgyrCDS7827 [Dimorphilus gyrociliatus]|uniref:DgyrCDS7827 n=1 Tax=Dimorphilus gyrociliatus TaxID=2664684 RepID=A0A7I8VSC3_9ANNE|nr:DgyrCDS7827 [Dimorphilus gyrociliatus]